MEVCRHSCKLTTWLYSAYSELKLQWLENKSRMMSETIFDKEITALEKRRTELETERQELLSGQVTISGPDGNIIRLDLGAVSESGLNDTELLEQKLRQTLTENPLVEELATSFKRKQELREEMSLTGDLPASTKRSGFNKLLLANRQFNLKVKRKNKLAATVLSSGWLLAVGLVVLLVWGGMPLLYLLTGGNVGGTRPVVHPTSFITARTTASLGAATPTLPVSSTPTVSPTRDYIQSSTVNSGSVSLISLNQSNLKIGNSEQIKDLTATPEASPSPVITPEPGEAVGQPPSSAGGLNGPHGAFFAPSRMTIAALELDTPIQRAITPESAPGLDQAPGTYKGIVTVNWPRPGEVVHLGAYPGELGNMVILGTQKNLSALRRLQQNDEIKITDRKGNIFIYRVLPFSPNGQTERVIEPDSDSWVFAPTQEAVLTIVVSMPRPLPPLKLDPSGKSVSGPDNLSSPPSDDYTSPKKLAYRAVLAVYAPKEITPAGTPVAVPEGVWQTRPASTSTPPPSPVSVPDTSVTASGSDPSPAVSPEPTVILPGLPHTGFGGGGVISQPPPTPTISPGGQEGG